MTDEQKPIEPAAPPEGEPAPEPAAGSEAQRLFALLKEKGQPVLIGLGLAVAVFVGVGAYRNYRQSLGLRASQALMNASTAQDLERVVSQYGGTPAAPIALLTLASQQFAAGEYAQAKVSYARFRQRFAEHPMNPAAALCEAQCLEAEGDLQAAREAYGAFLRDHPGHFLDPTAVFGDARCLTQLGRFDEARARYEDFIAANPESGWVPMAETAVEFVEKERRAQARPARAAASAAPAVSFRPAAAPSDQPPPAETPPGR